MNYEEFLASKRPSVAMRGMHDVPQLHPSLFPHQRDTVEFLLRAGSGAAFLDTGLGKTFVELEWARVIHERENKPVLILTPLAVAPQTQREATRFGMDAQVVRNADDVRNALCICNYESLHKLNPHDFAGVVLDESSILKSFTGVTTRRLMEAFAPHRWKLAATATPAPNDYMELGQHSQFLDAMDSNEMLARWFITDQTRMGVYRLKGHAVKPFWEWVASWARCVGKPSDLGYDDAGFALPRLIESQHIVDADLTQDTDGLLFRIPDTSATAIHKEKRRTVAARALKIAEVVTAEPNEPWIIWCDTDYEADAIKAVLNVSKNDGSSGIVEVRGSDSPEQKERYLSGFSDGTYRVIITKPSIAGFGLNWQHCARVAFVGLSFSYESYYQAIRRCWRFGQKREVHCHLVMAETEKQIWLTVNRKAIDHEQMKREMFSAMNRVATKVAVKQPYNPTIKLELPKWIKS